MEQNNGFIYLKPIHRYAYRDPSGMFGEVDGVVFYKPEGTNARACYRVLYPEMVDYIPVSEVENGNWEFTESKR